VTTEATRDEILMSLARLLGDVEAMDAAGERKEVWMSNAGTKARVAEARDILLRETIVRLEEVDQQKNWRHSDVEITAEMVQTLRGKCGLDMMVCKKALKVCQGDQDKAYEWLKTNR